MTDKIKSHAKEKYEAKRGKIITFDEYKIPKKDKASDYVARDFRYNGFYFIAWKHKLMQYLDAVVTDDEAKENIKHYGHAVGKLMIPSIVEYNETERCYYGLHKAVINTLDGSKEYLGASSILKGTCELLKYDGAGHIISIRVINLNENNEVIASESKCNNSLIPFINQMVHINNVAVYH